MRGLLVVAVGGSLDLRFEQPAVPSTLDSCWPPHSYPTT